MVTKVKTLITLPGSRAKDGNMCEQRESDLVAAKWLTT